jgi:FlaA1/EpsC-like NDP-sugar epimerase
MSSLHPFRVTPGMVLRMLADAALIQLALIAGYSLRLIYLLVIQDPQTITDPSKISLAYFGSYCNIAWQLTAVCLIVFYWNGFYTYGRYYSGRYKALVVFQAVTISYLIFAFLKTFLLSHDTGEADGIRTFFFPRGAIVLAWMFSVVLLVGARIWTQVWQQTVPQEREAFARARGTGHRVLVIGGAGYIGPPLLLGGYQVRLLDPFLSERRSPTFTRT